MDFRAIFARQLQDSVQDHFNNEPSFRKFFIEQDGLHNLEEDIVFTILGRYTCGSNCQVCFLKGHWLTDEQMAPHIPARVSPEWEAKALDIFSRFHTVACIDDLRGLKRDTPHLFDFYRAHAPKMEFHTSDNGFFSQFNILMEDVQFRNIGQLSFSDHILDKKGGLIVHDIIEKMCLLNDRSPISRLNFVITKGKPEDNPNVVKLAEWATKVDQTLAIYFHNDIRNEVDFFADLREEMGYRQPSCYYIETTTTPVTKCNVYSETVHLRYEDFFPDLYTSMEENASPFHSCKDGFSPEDFMVALLREKVRVYARNSRIMTQHNRLWDYFTEVANNLVINDDFTFIPAAILKPQSAFYKSLIGPYVNTYAGLIRAGAQKVIPIVEWKNG